MKLPHPNMNSNDRQLPYRDGGCLRLAGAPLVFNCFRFAGG